MSKCEIVSEPIDTYLFPMQCFIHAMLMLIFEVKYYGVHQKSEVFFILLHKELQRSGIVGGALRKLHHKSVFTILTNTNTFVNHNLTQFELYNNMIAG